MDDKEKTSSIDRIHKMVFADIYPMYIQKAKKKNRTEEEVDNIIYWLTGYDKNAIKDQVNKRSSFESFFENAPKLNPKLYDITGSICGYRIEEINDDLTRKVRCLDKLIDELAKGKTMEKILKY